MTCRVVSIERSTEHGTPAIDRSIDQQYSTPSNQLGLFVKLPFGRALPPQWYPIDDMIIYHTTGDVDEALELVHKSDGIARAKDVAAVQAEKAMSAVLTLQESPAREALVQLAHKIVTRNH